MPTDNDPMDETSQDYLGYMYPLVTERLVGPEFDDCGGTCYGDKAITSFKAVRNLARRGIGYVGMLRTAGRPKHRPNGDANAWPFKGGNKGDLDCYPRGHLREAYTKIKDGKKGLKWLKAELWRDNKWVTLLSSTYHSKGGEEVKRWEKAVRDRIWLKCSTALKRYNKYMGAVDAFNKRLAATLMAMGRCKQRFQRSIFLGWLLPAVGVVNVQIAFE